MLSGLRDPVAQTAQVLVVSLDATATPAPGQRDVETQRSADGPGNDGGA